VAKINIQVDTKANTYNITVNGEEIYNVKECNIAFYHDKPDVAIHTMEVDDKKDVAKRTMIMASKNDFVKEPRLEADISKYLNVKG
jgi:hypothetical protein